MSYPAVYALLRERMADERDIPTDDEIIAAALDCAKEAVRNVHIARRLQGDEWIARDAHDVKRDALYEIDRLRVEA